MLLRATAELDLDLSSSWFVGDILDDIEAGNRAGCRTILVDLGTEQCPEQQIRFPHFVAQDTPHALRIISACEHLGPPSDLVYRPPTWQSVTLPELAHPTTFPSRRGPIYRALSYLRRNA
jgi:D-glycero-D-manno-heptose 1,7-bisphosphate phosphatase